MIQVFGMNDESINRVCVPDNENRTGCEWVKLLVGLTRKYV